MEAQRELFDRIRCKLPVHLRLADIISDLLNIGSDSAYRRIRGEKELTFSELITLCGHFNISLDSLVGYKDSGVLFRYIPLDLRDLNNYLIYIRLFTNSIQTLAKAKEKEIYYTAEDIPIFHFLPFHSLAFFKVYVWYSAVCNNSITYEDFVRQLVNKEEIYEYYEKMQNAYFSIPSTEIWTTNTIDPLLRLLEYYYDMGAFEDKETSIILCNQLLQLVDRVMKWTESERKEGKGKYKLFMSATNPENSFMMLKNEGTVSTTIKLFTINSIMTTNTSFCDETEKWIKNTISKSTLLSGTSARERFKFFQGMKTKINNLMERFES